ncbi:MAG: hypothetical protein WDN76_05555 [Alphaproteobacteria bacterium]
MPDVDLVLQIDRNAINLLAYLLFNAIVFTGNLGEFRMLGAIFGFGLGFAATIFSLLRTQRADRVRIDDARDAIYRAAVATSS